MSVAKSYEKYPIVGDPYEHDKRQYVRIQYPCCKKSVCAKCGGIGHYLKEVRWYETETITDRFDARRAFLFGEQGFITIFKGDKAIIEKFFLDELPRYYGRFNTIFGWFIGSDTPIPSNLPSEITPVRLTWEEVSDSQNKIINYDLIRELINLKFYRSVPSKFIGVINDKIEKDFLVVKVNKESGFRGSEAYVYFLEDEEHNSFLWKTSAKKLDKDEIYHLKGSIKEHLIIDGVKTTILTRCREV